RNGLSTLQYGFATAVSGNLALTSQESVDVRPVLVPPWSVRLCRMRAVKFTSTPFQCCFCLTPRLSDRFTRLFVCPTLPRVAVCLVRSRAEHPHTTTQAL